MKKCLRLNHLLTESWEQKLYFSNVFFIKKIFPFFLQIDSMAENVVSITEHLSTQKFDLVINLPKRTSGGRRVSSFLATQGHTARRMAVDYGIPLITDVKCAKLLVSALYALKNQAPEVQTSIDCISEGRLIRLPGLIDTHVHLRYTQVSPDNYLMPCPSTGPK